MVVDNGISAHGGGEIKIASVIETDFTIFIKEEVTFLAPTSSGFYLKEDKERFVECKHKEKVRTEYAISDKTMLDEIVCSRASLIITKRSPMVESISVEGEILLENIGTKNGEICCQSVSMPFSETFECNGCGYGDIVCVRGDITYSDSIVVEQADGKKIDGVVKCTFDVSLYKEGEFSCVTDVFSASKQLLTTAKSHTVCEKMGNYTVIERVDGSVTLAENMPVCDNVLSACGYDCIINTTTVEDGCVKVEGVIVGKVIYSCSSPSEVVSASISLPFNLSVLLPTKSGDTVDIKGVVTSVNCRVRRGSEIDIKTDLALLVSVFANKQIAVISALEQGEDLVAPTSAFSVYIAEGGETLWETSSILGVSPEVVSQSTTLAFPLSKGDRITVYRALDSKKI